MSSARTSARTSARNCRKASALSPGPLDPTTPESGDGEAPCPLLNRELMHLEFQRRVLEEAQDPANPLIERARFLSIFFSNLDEFFMVRVAGLAKQVLAGVRERSQDGMTPAEQLAAVRRLATELTHTAQRWFLQTLRPELAARGILLLHWQELSDAQRRRASEYFTEMIYPVLTPLAFDPGHPFPHISNLSLNLAVRVLDGGHARFARVKVPETLPRLTPLKRSSGGTRRDGTPPQQHLFVWIEEVIQSHLEALFPGMEVVEVIPFHVTRDAEPAIQEIEADDLLETMEEALRLRRFGPVVRLMLGGTPSEELRTTLVSNLEVDPRVVMLVEGPLALSDLKALSSIDAPDLRFPVHVPALPASLRAASPTIFDWIRQEDRLLHHPYDSFLPVVRFLQESARDPDVLAIKQTLYRVGPDSPIVEALLEARGNGKQVSVLVELKARFDEESNIEWARRLEEEGVHVVYGVLGLKTHAKVALVVRRERGRMRRHVHLGTGNYNVATAQGYEDLGLFTSSEEIGADVSDLFNFLTGYSRRTEYRKLLVAPGNLR